MIVISTLLIFLTIIASANAIQFHPINGKCEDGWIEEYFSGLGCLWFYKGSLTFDHAKHFCEKKESRLIELETKDQLDRVSVVLKNVSGAFAPTWIWWGGAIQVGPDEDRNWTWIESGKPVEDWAWGPSEPGTGKLDNHLIFDYRASENESYYGADFNKNNHAFPVCQRPQRSVNNGGQSGELSGGAETQTSSSLPLIAGASAGSLVVIVIIIVTVRCVKKRYNNSEIVEMNEMYGKQEDYYEDEKANTKVTDNNQLYGDKEYADEYDFE